MELFDTTACLSRALTTHAATRNCIGKVAEIFVGRVLGVEINSVDGRKEVCPDFEGGEIKSVGKNNRGLIYKWRLEKDLKHHEPDFIYCFLQHRCPITLRDASHIADHFEINPPTLLVITLEELARRLRELPVRKFSLVTDHDGTIDKRIGYNREGYSEGGRQFNLNVFKPTHQKRKFFRWRNATKSIRVLATDGGAQSLNKYIGKMKRIVP